MDAELCGALLSYSRLPSKLLKTTSEGRAMAQAHARDCIRAEEFERIHAKLVREPRPGALVRFTFLCIVALIGGVMAGCGPQSGMMVRRSNLLGTYSYTAERRINGHVHLFKGTEETSVIRLPASESVVRWTDTSTGRSYTTTVRCLSGWLSWFSDGEDCIDVISPYDHANQLPGD